MSKRSDTIRRPRSCPSSGGQASSTLRPDGSTPAFALRTPGYTISTIVRTVALARCSSQIAVLPVCHAAPVSARMRVRTSRYSTGMETAPDVTASTAVWTAVALSCAASAAATAP